MQRRGIILYNISIYHVYKEEGHRPIVLNQCRNSVTNTDPELKQHRASVSLPSKHKTSIQRRPNVFDVGPTLHKCYTNALRLPGIQYWIFSSEQKTPNKRRSKVGPASTTSGQPKNDTRSTARVCRGGVISRR